MNLVREQSLPSESDDPLTRVNEEYLRICKMFELIENGDRESFFYHLRDIYSAMRYHLNLFHLACVRAYERFPEDEDIQHSCLGAFYEYGPRPELIAFRNWFESQQSTVNVKFRSFVPVLLELCDTAQTQYDRDLEEGLKATFGNG